MNRGELTRKRGTRETGRVVASGLGLGVAALLLLLAGEALAKGAGTGAAAGGFLDLIPERRELLGHLRGTSTFGGILLIVCAFVPLIWGGKLLRLSLAVGLGCTAYVLLNPLLVKTGLGPIAGTVLSALAAVGGGALGWYAYTIEVTLLSALLSGGVGLLVGSWLQMPWLAVALLVALAVIGLLLGLKKVPYLSVIQTGVLGGLLAGMGVMIVMKSAAETTLGWVGLATALVALIIGAVVQTRVIKTSPAGK